MALEHHAAPEVSAILSSVVGNGAMQSMWPRFAPPKFSMSLCRLRSFFAGKNQQLATPPQQVSKTLRRNSERKKCVLALVLPDRNRSRPALKGGFKRDLKGLEGSRGTSRVALRRA